ncbi:MAG TPA: AraC family transcriptional regulator [Mycobacteriales bacterium]|jgi:AraC-like DNA-binding protein|nr:AraC family transcriptional regulator [Mycobacteriales bacterium]
MTTEARRDWLHVLAAHGDRLVGALFGFDRLAEDWAVRFDNGLPQQLVYLVVAGSAAGQVQGQPVALHPGSLFWLPARTPFDLHATGDAPPVLYRFRLAGPADCCPSPCLVVLDAWELRSIMDSLVRELGSALEFRSERIRALLVVLFSSLFRDLDRANHLPPLSAAARARLEAYVDARSADRPTIAELADVVGLSTDYFRRRFRHTFGLAPRAWLVRRRIQQAMLRLDESDASISAIAARLGYPDVFLFSRQFKAVTGIAPTVWRARGSGGSADSDGPGHNGTPGDTTMR